MTQMNNPRFTLMADLSLEEGFEIVSNGKGQGIKHFYKGEQIGVAKGTLLFNSQKDNLKCTCCGLEANRWQIYLGIRQHPVMDLYHVDSNGTATLFTQDHIIPKAFGGTDDLGNLRVMCTHCNGSRSHNLNEDDLIFIATHKDKYIDFKVLDSTVDRLTKGLVSNKYTYTTANELFNNLNGIFTHIKSIEPLTLNQQNIYRKVLQIPALIEKKNEDLRT